MSDIQIRPGTNEDLPQILGVLASSLGESSLLKRTADLFAWKHLDNPFGPSLMLVATSGSQVVGVRAFMRWSLMTPGGAELRCARAVDTATHPGFQGRGIFRSLTLTAVELARDEGIHLIFNTPNEKSGPGYLKMGWQEVGWIAPLLRARLSRAVAPNEDGSCRLRDVLADAEPARSWPDHDRQPLGLRTPRSEEYFKWRFEGHPSARYGWVGDESGGAVVRASVRNGRIELLISELLGNGSPLRIIARTHRARYMAAHFRRDTPEGDAARRAGMRRLPGVRGLRLVANPLTDLDIDIFDLASWDLSLGDVELL